MEIRITTLTRTNPPALFDMGEAGFSQISVVPAGRMAFVSGQVAWGPGEAAPDGLGAQAERVAENVGHVLEALGAGPADVAMTRLYVVDGDTERFTEALGPIRVLFGAARPSITVVGVTALATPDLLMEFELVVRLPD